MRPERRLLADRLELVRAIREARTSMSLPTEIRGTLGDALLAIRKDEEGHFLSRSQDCKDKVSYAAKKEYKTKGKSRTKTSLGRYFRRQLKVTKTKVNDQILDAFCRKIFALLVDDSMFTILKGKGITDTYMDAIGGTSCMTGCCSRFTQIYADNPDVASMVVFKSSAYNARALLWKTEAGKQVLDRIYPNDGPPVEAFRRWCAKNKIFMRNHNSLPNGDVFFQSNEQHFISLKYTKDIMPYMDSFHYGKHIEGKKNMIRLSNKVRYGNLKFNSANGYMPRVCQFCKVKRASKTFKEKEYCGTCFHERYKLCTHCREYHEHDVLAPVSVHSWGYDPNKYLWCVACRKRDAYCCSHCDKWVDKELMRRTKDTKKTFCRNCFNGEIEHCDECENGFEEGGLHSVSGHGLLCEECCCECKRCNTRVTRWKYNKKQDLCFKCVEEQQQQEKKDEEEEEADAQGEAIEIIATA